MTHVKFEKTKKLTSLAFILLVVSLVFSISFSTIHPTTAQMPVVPEKVATPTFNPVGGTYSPPQRVALNCSTVGATIRYTSDGSEPSSSSAVYSIPITITGSGVVREKDLPIYDYNPQSTGTVTIKAKAFKSDMTDSDTATATYTLIIESWVATPTFGPPGGTYSSTQDVTLSSSTDGATIKYTIDGSEPTSSSMVYSSPISVSSTTTIKAKAFKNGMNDSNTASATYTITGTFPEPTNFPEPTKSPVAESAGFWSPPVITVIVVAAALAVIVPVTFVYKSRGKQETLPDEKPLPYRSELSTPINKPTVISRYNQPSIYGKHLTKPAVTNRSGQPSSYGQQPPFTKICPRCKRIVKDDYNLCPYCDKKLK